MIVIHVIRKPISESRVVANVLLHGTGALHIDACRIECAPMGRQVGVTAYQRTTRVISDGEAGTRDLDTPQWENTKGRFPSNVVLSHHPSCQSLGVQRVLGLGAKVSSLGQGRDGNHTKGIYGAKGSKVTTAYVAADGTEPVGVWECAEGCGVADLDGQSRGTRYLENLPVAASRFFRQFPEKE